MHLDFYFNGWRADIERFLGSGAVVMEPEWEGYDFVTLADPERNIFDDMAVDATLPADTEGGVTSWSQGAHPHSVARAMRNEPA